MTDTTDITREQAVQLLKELGHIFAVAMAKRGYDTKDSDLMNGLAAYHILELRGEGAELDAAHDMIVDEVTAAMFDRARTDIDR